MTSEEKFWLCFNCLATLILITLIISLSAVAWKSYDTQLKMVEQGYVQELETAPTGSTTHKIWKKQ